ncbi:DUF1822 family protein [Calothrix sp. PCC 6303]|uniref:DUF1822 family protein n=1 Tax=Calothrix sp. PCC 6303 TaxID=1170562 RepID=UPI0002A03956|nr:DUF1822 family protein [Calothrix sp. PCC 6303]AFZ01499.1 protein of unknown function DUF1822 [Calothrix sp. PCC 6303]
MYTLPLSFEFERLPTETIKLKPADIDIAVQLSQNLPDESRQWQTYLNALGLFILKNWLEERDEHLTVDWQDSSIAKPELANVFPFVTNLQVGEFQVCTIALDNLFERQIPLSRLVVDLPEFVPHFYVLVEVGEEEQSGMIRGIINYQQLQDYLQIYSPANSVVDGNYQIPLDWFETEPNNILLYLRILKPQAIQLPTIDTNRQQELANLANQLAQLLPQLQTPSVELWQVLNWQQISAVVTFPDLLEWVYQLQTNRLQINPVSNSSITGNLRTENLQKYLRDRIRLITQPVINLGRWMWGELDEIGEALSWELIGLTPATEFRSPTAEFAVIRSQLETQGVEIPSSARCGHYNFYLAGNSLRIYAVAWNYSTEDDPNTWSLFLILGAPAPNLLPNNLKFRVSDKTGILSEQQVEPQQVNSYLFTAVVGTWEEKFTVTISIADGVEVTLPTFAFDIRQVG